MEQAARGQRAPGDAAAGGREPPVPGPCATFSIQPAEPFNFSKPYEWEKWIRRFERFSQASNLHTSSQVNQINTVLCHACGKNGHYQKVCVSSRKVNEIQEQDPGIFLGTVMAEGDPWLIDIKIKDCEVQFKIDTDADVTIMPDHVFHEIFKDEKKPALQRVTKPLLGPGCSPLNVIGVSNMLLQKGDKHTLEEVYVVKRLHLALLGRPAITKLGLVTHFDDISIHTLQERYPKLCSGLGLIQRPYTIKLSPGAVPFSLKTPRCIPLPLMPKVKN